MKGFSFIEIFIALLIIAGIVAGAREVIENNKDDDDDRPPVVDTSRNVGVRMQTGPDSDIIKNCIFNTVTQTELGCVPTSANKITTNTVTVKPGDILRGYSIDDTDLRSEYSPNQLRVTKNREIIEDTE